MAGRLQLRQHGGHLVFGQAQRDQVVGCRHVGGQVIRRAEVLPDAGLEHQLRVHAERTKGQVRTRVTACTLALHQGGEEGGRPAFARWRQLQAARHGQRLQQWPGLLSSPVGQLGAIHRLLLSHLRAALPGQQRHQGQQPLHLRDQRAMRRQAPCPLSLQQQAQCGQGLGRMAGHGEQPGVGEQFVQGAVKAPVMHISRGQCAQGGSSWRGRLR